MISDRLKFLFSVLCSLFLLLCEPFTFAQNIHRNHISSFILYLIINNINLEFAPDGNKKAQFSFMFLLRYWSYNFFSRTEKWTWKMKIFMYNVWLNIYTKMFTFHIITLGKKLHDRYLAWELILAGFQNLQFTLDVLYIFNTNSEFET